MSEGLSKETIIQLSEDQRERQRQRKRERGKERGRGRETRRHTEKEKEAKEMLRCMGFTIYMTKKMIGSGIS